MGILVTDFGTFFGSSDKIYKDYISAAMVFNRNDDVDYMRNLKSKEPDFFNWLVEEKPAFVIRCLGSKEAGLNATELQPHYIEYVTLMGKRLSSDLDTLRQSRMDLEQRISAFKPRPA